MSDRHRFLTYFPNEYQRYTLDQLYDVCCVNCGGRFGDHLNDSCPYNLRVDGKKFVAPKITTQKGNKPIC